jgi:thiol-disulfide isomerase/thioredoxin
VFAAIGLAVLGLAVGVGVRDVDEAATVWDEMGPLAPGREIPRFRASLVDGGVLNNDALEGQVTLLNFWATWCGVCEQQMPAIVSLDQKYGGSGVHVIGVNQDREGDQERKVVDYRTGRDMSLAMALDSGTMGRAFRVSMIPHVAIIDKRGELRFVHQGRVGEDTLAEELEQLLSE